jgi:hypothetical protein
MIGGLLQRDELAAVEEPSQVMCVLLIPRSGEQFEHHKSGRRERFARLDRRGHTSVRGAAGGALKLDPGRRVDENHADEEDR